MVLILIYGNYVDKIVDKVVDKKRGIKFILIESFYYLKYIILYDIITLYILLEIFYYLWHNITNKRV